ncbi:hypothetical protein CDAR_270551 [Caerostris darwini]|uniref:Uncharacterized protein n=1 Tax=Caerostris darwini TaxID=1538125 RepID=A0AAV4UMX7_9ARAC|nr:hypothetical protein CDAR_270551 [Caerostris darwini]
MSSVCFEGECLAHSRAAAVIQSDETQTPINTRIAHRIVTGAPVLIQSHTQVIEYFVIDHHSDKMQCLHLNGFHLRLRWEVEDCPSKTPEKVRFV